MKLGVITGTTRNGNAGTAIGAWVTETLSSRTDVEVAPLAVADFNLNFLTEETMPSMAGGVYEDPQTTEWSKAIAVLDAFIFVTPEYNAAPPAAFKNAVDLLFGEWAQKPVGFVGYGFHGGVRAIDQWRPIVRNLKMIDAEKQVEINLASETIVDGVFTPAETRAEEVNALVDELIAARQLETVGATN